MNGRADQLGKAMKVSKALRRGFVSVGVAALLASVSAAGAGGSRPALRVAPPEISGGGVMAGLMQSDPEGFRAPPGPHGPQPPAQPLGTNFDTITFDGDAALNGFYHIPPDPNGAVGTTHFVNTVNSTIQWYTKAGVLENSQSLSSFFATATTPPTTNTFDPKVIFDQYSSRFIVTTMERIEASPTNQSRVYFAVSDDADPNGTWYFHTLTTEETIGGAETWADFPGLAVDSEAIYYTNNQFRHNNQPSPGAFAGVRLRIIAKTPLYTGGAATVTSYDPVALANTSGLGDGGMVATTFQPTQMYGDAAGGVGTYLLAYGGLNDGVNLYLEDIQVDSPLSSPTFTGYFSAWGTIAANDDLVAFPLAPQMGTATGIETNDRRFSQNAVSRGSFIYAALPIRPPSGTDSGQVTAHWFKINPTTIASTSSDPPPTDQGNIGGETIATGTYTFFPSVAVNSSGDLAVGFAASASTIFPGSYYTVRLAGDPAGTTRTPTALRAGLDYYVRKFVGSGGTRNRWGDYTGTWLDPSDEATFCVFNEHAMARGTTISGEDGRWATAWGCFTTSTTAATLRSFTANARRGYVILSWRMASELAFVGYNVYGERNGLRVKLNRTLIASRQGVGGSAYRYTYRPPARTQPFGRFWLQGVKASGARAWYGPVHVRLN